MFPFEKDDVVQESLDIPYEYGIDFETNQLTGSIVAGKEAIKVWIYLALNTTRYIYPIYTWNYGNELEDLIGSAYTKEFIEIESKSLVEEALSINPYIKDITNFDVEIKNENLKISFTVDTDFGEIDIDV